MKEIPLYTTVSLDPTPHKDATGRDRPSLTDALCMEVVRQVLHWPKEKQERLLASLGDRKLYYCDVAVVMKTATPADKEHDG